MFGQGVSACDCKYAQGFLEMEVHEVVIPMTEILETQLQSPVGTV